MNSGSIPVNTKSPTRDLEDDPRWLLVQRIAASRGFLNSPRLSSLLIHVCRESLRGKDASINERSIGEMVFQRSSDYDPQVDNIVRSHASRLRLRLEEYFTAEGAPEEWRVSIPRGSYIPVFEKVDSEREVKSAPPSPPDSVMLESDSSPLSRPYWHRPSRLWVMLLVLATGTITTAAILFLQFRSPRHQTPSHNLWSQLFRSDETRSSFRPI